MTKLDRCWKNCLRMWKWIAENWKSGIDVDIMKEQWLRSHKFSNLYNNCFFCNYASDCDRCPATIINKRFHCMNTTYHFWRKPKAFYAKLSELDAKRTGKKKP